MNNNDSRNDSHYPLDFDSKGSVNVSAANGRHQLKMQLLSLKEAKEILGIGDWMLFQLLHSNAIKSVKIGNRRLISVHALEEYIIKLEEESEVRGNYGY